MNGEITICMGSSCFTRGNSRNLEVIEDYLQKHGLSATVKLTGCRCEGICQQGPIVRLGGSLHRQVASDELPLLLDLFFGGGGERG